MFSEYMLSSITFSHSISCTSSDLWWTGMASLLGQPVCFSSTAGFKANWAGGDEMAAGEEEKVWKHGTGNRQLTEILDDCPQA